MKNCIFCKIIQNKVPGNVIYSDDHCLAILDINPASNGHTLILSRKHYTDVSDADAVVLQQMILLAQKIGEKAKESLGATGYNILNASGKDAQQSVPHLHFHVVPRYPKDGLNLWFAASSPDSNNLAETYTRLKMV